ncbi:uncharacterized protein si:dkeyp-117h8.4 isoform X2 [Acanthochromis polyacanthus]|nr:uncharacterized protein si:dkeyp-117h8.4 isoform X2 [Acanthochromis polyacanthus]
MLGRYMKQSKLNLSQLESKSMADLGEESIRAPDITQNSQLDFTYQDDGANEASDTATQLEVEDKDLCPVEMPRSEVTQLTVSSLDESQRNFSQVELQPEDEDEELQMSLSSHGSSLVELYPSMISRLGRAWHRQHISTAADSVLRRYRRWRQQSNRSNPNYTFVVPLRHTSSNSRKIPSKENHSKPVKKQFTKTETTPRSPLQVVTSLHDWQPKQQSPGKERGLQHHALLAMDFSEISKPKEILLNETFIMSQQSPPKLSRPREQASIHTVSPSRPNHTTPKTSVDSFFNFKRSVSAHSVQTAGSSMYLSETSAMRERADIYGSPVRLSPLKARMMTLSRSPQAVSRSPKDYAVEYHSRESMRSGSPSTSLSTPPQRPVVPLRMLHHQDSHQLHSPQSAGRHKLRRHLSFDSSLKPIQYSPKKVDEDFMKLYHKFVCQNKSAFLNGPPCRLCARNSAASRDYSSSALAALALSPHRSILRKRHRELGWDNHPQSKRFREEYGTYSPGSRRHRWERLRRSLSPSEVELPHGGLSYSSSKHSMFQRCSTQQPPAHQESWMSRRLPVSAADFSGLGNSLESKMTDHYSPRKWR